MTTSEYSNYEIHRKLIELIRSDFTGSLTTRPEKRKLFFQNGNLVYANSDIDGESFADILTEMNVLSPDVLVELKLQAQAGLSLGKRIRDDGLATPHDLALALKQQIMRVVSRIVNTKQGEYEVVAGNLPPKIPTLKIHTLPLFVKSFLLVDDPSFPSDIHEGLTLQLAVKFQDERDKLNLPISYLEALNRMDHPETIEQICAESDLDIIQGKRLAYTLTLLGAANLVAQTHPSPDDILELPEVPEIPEISTQELLDELDSQTTIPDQVMNPAQLEDTFFGRLPVTSQDLTDELDELDSIEPLETAADGMLSIPDEEEPIAVLNDPISELNRVLADPGPASVVFVDDHSLDDSETVPATPLDELLDDNLGVVHGPYLDYNSDDFLSEDANNTAPMKVVSQTTEPSIESPVDLRERGFIMPEPSEQAHVHAGPIKKKSSLTGLIVLLFIVAIGAAAFFYRSEIMAIIAKPEPLPIVEVEQDPTPQIEPALPLENSLFEDEADASDGEEELGNETELESVQTPNIESSAPDTKREASTPDIAPVAQAKAEPSSSSESYQAKSLRDASELRQTRERYAIAFTVACEMKTLDDYFDALDNQNGVRILPRKIGSRSCFIAMWGLFKTSDEAKAAIASMPRQLKTSSDPPWVINLDKYL